MSIPWRAKLQAAAAVLAIAVFSGLSHYSNSGHHATTLGALLALGPWVGAVVLALWRSTHWLLAAATAAVLIAAIAGQWDWIAARYHWFYMTQDVGLYGMLASTFGRSLLPPRVPLCTRFAAQIHGPLLEVEMRYTRRLTAFWCGFFMADALVALALFIAAPLRVWSFFSYILTPVLLVGMFVGEQLVRRVALPRRARGGVLSDIAVYLQRSP